MAELYEVLLVDHGQKRCCGWVVDEDTDRLLTAKGKVLVFSGRPALEHYAQEHGFEVVDDLPDEVDLDLGGWLTGNAPPPPEPEVSELWHLLLEDPHAGAPLQGDEVEEAYDDLVEEVPGWFEQHGDVARKALGEAVRRLRSSFAPAP